MKSNHIRKNVINKDKENMGEQIPHIFCFCICYFEKIYCNSLIYYL